MPAGTFKRTKEYCQKMSESCKGRVISEIHKRKIGLTNAVLMKKLWQNPEYRKMMSEVHKGKKFSEEHKQRMREHSWVKGKFGEKNSNWKGGCRKDERNDPAYHQWVRKVKERDSHTCRINNEDCSGYNIVHHILPWRNYPELRYQINNGITLCQAHHPRKRAEEKRLIPVFQDLVPVLSERL